VPPNFFYFKILASKRNIFANPWLSNDYNETPPLQAQPNATFSVPTGHFWEQKTVQQRNIVQGISISWAGFFISEAIGHLFSQQITTNWF